jgi:hypothetical protein
MDFVIGRCGNENLSSCKNKPAALPGTTTHPSPQKQHLWNVEKPVGEELIQVELLDKGTRIEQSISSSPESVYLLPSSCPLGASSPHK